MERGGGGGTGGREVGERRTGMSEGKGEGARRRRGVGRVIYPDFPLHLIGFFLGKHFNKNFS